MKDKLDDLNTHLFAQIERLGDEDLKGDDLKMEVSRAKSIAAVACQITATAGLKMDAAKMMNKAGKPFEHLLPETNRTIEHQPSAALAPPPPETPRLATATHRAKPLVRSDEDILAAQAQA